VTTKREFAALIALCIAVSSASCGTGDKSHRDGERVGLSRPQAPHWSLVEEWRVGGAVSGPHSLSRVRAIRVLPDGRIVVLEADDQQVHILSARGVPLKTIGRRGNGPGEFTGANNLWLAPDGQIIVYDLTARRLTIFSPDGRLLKTQPHTSGARIVGLRPDGRLEELDTQVVNGPNGKLESVDFRRIWSSDYTRADTVAGAPCPLLKGIPREFASYEIASPDAGRYEIRYPFLPNDRLDIPDGTWVSDFPDFRVLTRVAVGACASAASITLQGPPIQVPAAVRTEIQDALLAHSHPGDTLAPDPHRLRAVLPLFESLTTDAQGRLWVARFVESTVHFIKSTVLGMPSFSARGTTRFELYSPQGALIALVSAPSYLRIPRNPATFAVTNERVYAIVLDENDIRYLCSFRIAPAR
jgi:hypothetical protein